MKRPNSWRDLPRPVFDRWAEHIELDYDPYESSRAEVLDNIHNGVISVRNAHTLDDFWRRTEDSEIADRCWLAWFEAIAVTHKIEEILQ